MNVWLFDFESLATVIVAYVMYAGGSYANTTSRCLGVLSALVELHVHHQHGVRASPACDLLLRHDCGGNCVRISSPTSRWSRHRHDAADGAAHFLQFAMSRQLVLSCFVMAAAELLVYGENSLKHLRKVVAETYTEARVVFVEVFQTNLSDCWANINGRHTYEPLRPRAL